MGGKERKHLYFCKSEWSGASVIIEPEVRMNRMKPDEQDNGGWR